jgi:hypothetical protein
MNLKHSPKVTILLFMREIHSRQAGARDPAGAPIHQKGIGLSPRSSYAIT